MGKIPTKPRNQFRPITVIPIMGWKWFNVQNPPQTRNNMRESPINGVSPARRPPTLLTLDFLKPALCCNRAPRCKIGITIFNTCERI